MSFTGLQTSVDHEKVQVSASGQEEVGQEVIFPDIGCASVSTFFRRSLLAHYHFGADGMRFEQPQI